MTDKASKQRSQAKGQEVILEIPLNPSRLILLPDPEKCIKTDRCLQSCNETQRYELFASKVDSDASLYASIESNRQWPSYRGYFASGYLDDVNLPDSFNVETLNQLRIHLNMFGR